MLEVFNLRSTWQWPCCSVINSVRASGSKLSDPYSTSCLEIGSMDIGKLGHQQCLRISHWETVALKRAAF